jgi:hypothetical protein
MMARTPPAQGAFPRYGARALDDPRHDPYAARQKLADHTLCPNCGAVHLGGRWQWTLATAGSPRQICPACRRIRDGMPAGRLVLQGPYVAAHAAELVRLARRQGELERAEHAMHRIIDIDQQGERIEITTTDIHLPRRIGEALERAHDGDLTLDFGADAYEVRAHWQR